MKAGPSTRPTGSSFLLALAFLATVPVPALGSS